MAATFPPGRRCELSIEGKAALRSGTLNYGAGTRPSADGQRRMHCNRRFPR